MSGIVAQNSFCEVPDITLGDGIRRRIPLEGIIEDLSMSPITSGPMDVPTEQNVFRPRDYELKKLLGKGEFGEVYLAQNLFGKSAVMKRISKSSANFSREYVRREKIVGEVLNHENIVPSIAYFETTHNCYLVFPYYESRDMVSYLEDRNFWPLEEKHARLLFKQLTSAVIHIHSKGIAHRDLKLENILIGDKGQKVKLIDFGLCTLEDSKCVRDRVGSIDYVAPELLAGKPYDAFKADIFSLGVVLFCLLFGKFPFVSEERVDEIKRGILKKIPLDSKDKLFSSVSKEAKDLLSNMMEPHPQNRCTIQEVFNHPWVHQK